MELSIKTFDALVASIAQLEMRIRLLEDPDAQKNLNRNQLASLKRSEALDFLIDKSVKIKSLKEAK
jgi:hypothetical protein